MEIRVKDIMNLMDAWAPPALAESWDHPGLQAGSPDAPVHTVLTALDLTRANLDYAMAHGVDMIVSHHPFLFKGMKTVDLRTEKGRMLADLLSHGITAFAAHTNLDTAAEGVNDALADVLGLENRTGLVPVHQDAVYKLVVYVPVAHEEAVRRAVTDAGAGIMGAYTRCTFSSAGTGRFVPGAGAHPYLGSEGREEEADEVRLETFLPESAISRVMAAVRKAHPYETPVADLYPLRGEGRWDSMGRVGELPRAMSGEEAVRYVKEKLGLAAAKYAGPIHRTVRRAAVLGGAGAEFMGLAAAAGADLYLTGDVKYHEAQEAAAMGLLIIDGGHFHTEKMIIPRMAARLREAAENNGWDLSVVEDPTAEDVFSYL